jgi:hypothetical protein
MSKSTKQTTENKPPEWAVPLFKQSATEAQSLYNSGQGGNTFQGSTVAPLSGTTMAGVNQLAQAGANSNTDQTRPLYQGIGAASVGPSYSEQNLGDMANGSFLKSGNPFFSQALEGQLNDTAAQVQSQFAGAGRFGSGANVGALTDSLGDIRSNALYNQFNQDTQNMLAANGLLDAQRNTGLDRALSTTNALAGQDQQQFQNRLAGAGATLQAGDIVDRQAQQQLADEVAKFYANDNQDWTRLGLLQSAAAGSAGNYGTQVATSRQPIGVGSILGGLGALLGK